jgi:hypothetical protein
MTFLTAKPFDFGHRQTLNADLLKRFFHFIKLEWFDDRFDFFHVALAFLRALRLSDTMLCGAGQSDCPLALLSLKGNLGTCNIFVRRAQNLISLKTVSLGCGLIDRTGRL